MSAAVRLVQIENRKSRKRFVCLVDEPWLRVLERYASVHELATAALAAGECLSAFARAHAGPDRLPYDAVYVDRSEWRLLPPIDHPSEPARCMVSGTGLTHRRSVEARQAMHAVGSAPTDSMRMYELGVTGGRPEPGAVGAAPEWFYKGTGLILRGHGEPLIVPSHAEDGGEEAEIAGVYLIDQDGVPRRIGMAAGNEFSDHKLERRNYLYLAASKLRTCALGPELVVDPDFRDVEGEVVIERNGAVLWSRRLRTGDAAMCHSLQNIEHHHFKHEAHRRPGDVHVHFLGADAISFAEGLELRSSDVVQIAFAGFGRALRNPLIIEPAPETPVCVLPL